MDGYLGRPDLTAVVLKNGWFHTGDRGRVNDLGRIWLAGRIKEQINRAGFKIQPAEIDLLLERHPAVAEACVFGLPDRTSGEVVAVAIRLADGATASPLALQSWCLQHLRREAVPERWFIVDAIPRTGNGKVSRDAVRQSLGLGALPEQIETSETSAWSVRTAVEQAWRAVLGDIALARGLSWQAAGGDSINTLRLWLRLEETLGVRLSLDAIHPDAGIDEVVAAVKQALAAQSSLPGHQPCDKRPMVFFLPPAEGDLPMLAQFRAAFASKVRFVVIQYPDWRDMIRNGGGFDTMVDAAVAQIRAQSVADAVFLAGYSFGGIMAYEVARRLVAAGRRIGFLGLIDARYGGDAPRKRESALAKSARRLRRVTRPWRALEVLPRRLIAALSSVAAFHSLAAIGRMANALPPKLAFELNWHLTAHLRMKALRRWAVEPQDIPVVLFRSKEDWSLADYGWGNLSRQLSVVAIEGTHLSLFDPPYRDVLCARFFEILEAAWSAVTLIA